MLKRATYRTALLIAILALVACSTSRASPSPPGVVEVFGELARRGATVTDVVSGDAGCSDPTLVANAVRFTLTVPGGAPARIHLFAFNDVDALRRATPSLDACRAAFDALPGITDVGGLTVETYAAFGAPWNPRIDPLLRESLVSTPGTP